MAMHINQLRQMEFFFFFFTGSCFVYLLKQIFGYKIPHSILCISNSIVAKLCIFAISILTDNSSHSVL